MDKKTNQTEVDFVKELLCDVFDPEIPVLSVVDLGIVQEVRIRDNKVIVDILPTYTGCPAMDMIAMQIREKLFDNGYRDIEVNIIRSPVWNTDMISPTGREKIQAYGIAAPQANARIERLLDGESNVKCPHCHSEKTSLISAFGSTACKALMQCNHCAEPFEYFKCTGSAS